MFGKVNQREEQAESRWTKQVVAARWERSQRSARAAALEKEQNESSRTEHARAPAGGAAVGELDRAAAQRRARLLCSLLLLLPALAVASLFQV